MNLVHRIVASWRWSSHVASAVLLLVFAPPGRAAPTDVPFTGQLLEAGVPVNGMRYFTFTLYFSTAPSKQGSTQPREYRPAASQSESLMVREGVFTTRLGFPAEAWRPGAPSQEPSVGISVNGSPELEDPVRLGMVPNSINAISAETAQRSDTASVSESTATAPGVNFVSHGQNPVTLQVLGNWTEADNVSITAPADGYVWVTANGSMQLGFVPFGCSGGRIFVRIAQSTPSADLNGQEGRVSDCTTVPFAVTQVFQVTAGPQTFRLYAKGTGTNALLLVDEMQAMWVPKRYP